MENRVVGEEQVFLGFDYGSQESVCVHAKLQNSHQDLCDANEKLLV